MYSSTPKRPCRVGTSRALCQSVMKTSWSGSIVRTVARNSVAKWPESGATSRTRGCTASVSLRKRSRVPNGVVRTASSRTTTSRPATLTESIPNAGRRWVRPQRAMISDVASDVRTIQRSVPPGDKSVSRRAVPADIARSGAIRSDWAW